MNTDQFIINLLDSLVSLLRQDHQKYQKVIDYLQKAGYELSSLSRDFQKDLPSSSPAANDSLEKFSQSFQDPSKNPIMAHIQKSGKIIQDNKKFQKEYLDAMDQIKQEEIIDNLKTSSPQP